jgi:pullulanase
MRSIAGNGGQRFPESKEGLRMVSYRRPHIIKKAIGIVATLAMAAIGTVVAPMVAQANEPAKSVAPTGVPTASRNVEVIAFQQPWKTVAQECTNVYGPEGVAYVEVSPSQESIKGTSWWTSYQPVSNKLDSKLGTEKDFTSMVGACKAAGVGVIADVVMNQTTGTDAAKPADQTGVAGTKYNGKTGTYPGFTGSKNQYPGGATAADFHKCTKNISDYTNQDEVQNCRLSSMWDWNTSSAKVQDIFSDYLADLYKKGVVGFRIDAAKHINTDDLTAIKQQMAQKVGKSADQIYWIQETIGNQSEAKGIQPNNYYQNGEVTEFGFKSEMNQKFKGKIAELKGLSGRLIPSVHANAFVTNWDTERQDGTLTYKDGSRYQLANAFLLGYGYGTPRLLSDYKFGNDQAGHDSGAPGATDTSVPVVDMDKACANNKGDWNCEERWTSTRGMVAFHNYVADAKLTDWQDDGDNNIAFSRSGKGFLAINNTTADKAVKYTTDLADGTYCNVYAAMDCSKTVDVKNGTVSTTIPARSAVALSGGATKDSHPRSTLATDPSDPEKTDEKDGNVPTDQTLTIYYKPTDGWKNVNLHYGIGNDWTTVPGVKMDGPDAQGYYTKTINTKGQEVQYCFNDGNNHWDNPVGGGNYTAAKGVVQMGVADHDATIGNPETIEARTHVVVHYKAPAGDPNRGAYIWGTDKSGTDLAGKNYPFTGSDSWGKVLSLDLPGSFDKLGLIITTPDWNKFGNNDRSMTVSKDGTAEVWIDGSKNADGDKVPTVQTAPEDYKPAKATTLTLTVHYHRADGLYYNAADTSTPDPQWDLWTWNSTTNGFQSKFTGHDAFGEIAKITLSNYMPQIDAKGNSDIGLLRRYGADTWKNKDCADAGDIKVPADTIVYHKDGTATAEVWMLSDNPTVYAGRPVIGKSITSASISDFDALSVKLSQQAPKLSKDDVTVTDADGKSVVVKAVKINGSTVAIATTSQLKPDAKYTVGIKDFGSSDAIAGAIVRTKAFDQKYAYDGEDLGATWSQKKTTFKLWAPTATKVMLNTYTSDSSADAAKGKSIEMTRGDKGVWTVSLDGDAKDTAYDYSLTFADGSVNESPDPYATAAVVNGDRSVVLSDAEKKVSIAKSPKFSGRNQDAVIAETHIRDFSKSPSSGVSADRRGKYLGMVETGTKNAKGQSTGVDYLRKLGITHVQIQPMFDYASVDETKPLDDSNYNWGYDPKNYNVPEGSYSSNAADPTARIKEAKEMVSGLHKNGLRVIMDVVYNHVYDASKQALGLTVPGYYFRYDANGKLVSNSGCGNDTASERAMMRKYIVDSVTYWAKNYKVNGFRFDLMGLEDLDTMKAVRAALDKIDPSIIVLGEGWDMNSTMPKSEMSIQPNAYELDNTGSNGTKSGSTVSFFNDSIRDALKGSVFSDTDTGFISGKAGQEKLVLHNELGCAYTDDDTKCWNGNAQDHYAQTGQVIQYAEIHDNLTLFDKLKKSVAKKSGESDAAYRTRLEKMAKLADSAIFLAQGVPEIQLGQEFLRSKGGDGNSYKAGDSVNQLDWDQLSDADAADSADYVRGLIALRKAIPTLRQSDYQRIAKSAKPLRQSDGVVAWQLTDGTGKDVKKYVVVLNANEAATKVSEIPAGTYRQLVANSEIADKAASMEVKDGFTAPALSATVLEVASDTDKPTNPDKPDKPSKPTNPDQPTKPDKPTNPTNPENPGKPSKPTNPDKPTTPTKPTKPVKPSHPTKPVNPNKPSNPSKPVKPSQHARPKNPSTQAPTQKSNRKSAAISSSHHSSGSKPLASTGAAVAGVLLVAVLLIGAGIAGWVIRRNRM